jgi:hypothetical protein
MKTCKLVLASAISVLAVNAPVYANTCMIAPIAPDAVQPIVQDQFNDTYSLIHPAIKSQPGVLDDAPLSPLNRITPDEGVQEIYRGPVEFIGTIDELPKKLKFKDRHPRIYWTYRKGRLICIMVMPFVSVTSQVCQIIVPFLL